MTTVDEQARTPQDEAAEIAAETPKGGTPAREYVVLEQVIFEEGDHEVTYCWLVVHKVAARNGRNALRKAFRELRELRADDEAPLDEATLVTIPAGQWKPTPVRAKRREHVTVDVG